MPSPAVKFHGNSEVMYGAELLMCSYITIRLRPLMVTICGVKRMCSCIVISKTSRAWPMQQICKTLCRD